MGIANVHNEKLTWGREWNPSIGTRASVIGIFFGAPLAVFYFYLSCTFFQGAFFTPLVDMWKGRLTLSELYGFLPSFTLEALAIFLFWIAFQLTLFFLPDFFHRLIPFYRGGETKGSVTPAGYELSYNINGLQAWFLSVLGFVVCSFGLKLFSPTIIVDHWGELLLVTSLCGNLLAYFVYFKASYLPSWPKDNKVSGSLFYDFYMGIELNPRIRSFDFKLFFNGRPGIIAWTLINLSFAAKQYALYGYVTNSMLLVNLLHGIYVVYFFWKESWYLKTIDICHEHFGWMLAWGDLTFLPYMYTLQGLYLVYHPVELSSLFAWAVLALGLFGFWFFASANNQKDRFQKSGGNCLIWGKKPEYIETKYVAADGKEREGKLLISGFWGKARHMNYTGDLIGSLAYGLSAGFDSFVPYFYFFFMAILLVHRCLRDESRCLSKYGKSWHEYCRLVPYRFIPGLF